MLTIKKLIVCYAFVAVLIPLPAGAKTDTQTANKPNKPSVPGGYGVSTTTGWRKIDGWQSDVVKHDKNLRHWDWSAMREMNKGYVRLKAGQRDVSRPSHYTRPVAVNPTKGGYMPTGGHYARTVNVPLPSRDTYAKLHAPAVKVTLAAPNTNIKLSAPSTNARLAAPQTFAKLAAPQTHVQLASKDTSVQWAAAKKFAIVPHRGGDAMADVGGYTPDSFETPEAESNPYGLARHQYGHQAVAVVKGKLAKKKH